MNKREFLIELEKQLSILDKKEQRDIIDEYSQHIDIKMEKGMSEEEAIKDFGDIKELVSDILLAYHVNPQFEAKEKKNFENVKKSSENLCKTVGGILVVDGNKISKLLKKLWLSIWKIVKLCRGFITLPFVNCWNWIKRYLNRAKGENMEIVREDNNNKNNNIFSKLLRGCKIFIKGCINLSLWCIKWTYNLVLIMLILFTGSTALMLLFSLGVLIVLMLEGYPLTGITIAFAGGILCFSSFVVLCFNIMKRGSKKTVKAASDKKYEEEHITTKGEVSENA